MRVRTCTQTIGRSFPPDGNDLLEVHSPAYGDSGEEESEEIEEARTHTAAAASYDYV